MRMHLYASASTPSGARRHVASRLARAQQLYCRYVGGDGVGAQRRAAPARLPRPPLPDVFGEE
eukprot:2705055-Pleurochrysis_carterae.AAC.1